MSMFVPAGSRRWYRLKPLDGLVCHVPQTRDAEFNGMSVTADQVHAAFMSALSFAYSKVVTTGDFPEGIASGVGA
jgi:hypothetical protein